MISTMDYSLWIGRLAEDGVEGTPENFGETVE